MKSIIEYKESDIIKMVAKAAGIRVPIAKDFIKKMDDAGMVVVPAQWISEMENRFDEMEPTLSLLMKLYEKRGDDERES